MYLSSLSSILILKLIPILFHTVYCNFSFVVTQSCCFLCFLLTYWAQTFLYFLFHIELPQAFVHADQLTEYFALLVAAYCAKDQSWFDNFMAKSFNFLRLENFFIAKITKIKPSASTPRLHKINNQSIIIFNSKFRQFLSLPSLKHRHIIESKMITFRFNI